MDNRRSSDYVGVDIDAYLKKQMEETLWNLGLTGQEFPVALGAGNPQWSPAGGSVSNVPSMTTAGSVEGYTGPQQVNPTGLQPHVVYARNLIVSTFNIKNIGGYSHRNINGTNKLSDHAKGLALDVMIGIPGTKAIGTMLDLGNRVAEWAVLNRDRLRVKYIIWQNQFKSANTNWEWESYVKHGPAANQQSVTGRHEDHVHISFHP